MEGTSEARLKVYSGKFSQIAEGLHGVFERPHGCFEQISSTTYPSILALQFLKNLRKSSPKLEKEALGYIRMGYQGLLTFEVEGGGFSLFGRAPASVVLTAYGLMEFADMQNVAWVDPALIRRTRKWLLAEGNGTWDTKPSEIRRTAYVAWALSKTGDRDEKLDRALDRIAQQGGKKPDDPYVLALRANALVAGGRVEQARVLLGRLEKLRGKGARHWEAEGSGLLYSRGKALSQETTAWAALAMLDVNYRPDITEEAVAWLADNRSARGTWDSTGATVAAMRALLATAKSPSSQMAPVNITVNGHSVPAGTIKASRGWHQTVELTQWLRVGVNDIELNPSGRADRAYQLVTSHYVPWGRASGPDPRSPLQLRVNYTNKDNKAGDPFRCEVEVVWKRGDMVKMPMVEVGVPPGMDPVPEDLDTLVKEKRIESYGMAPRHLVFYLPPLEKATAFHFGLRSRNRGQVMAPPSRAYPYYEPEYLVETPPVKLNIR